jgi:hypothetical protein
MPIPEQAPFTPPFPPLAAFGGSPIYFTGEDALKLTVQNAASGVIVTLTGRMLPFGATRPVPFKQTLTPATDRTASSVVVGIGDGWLLNAQAIVSTGSPLTGQCFARLSVVHGLTSVAEELFSLGADYVTSKQPMSYPGSGVLDSTDGAGAIRSITGTNPAAGAEISETVPAGARWEFLAMFFVLVTSATVASRLLTALFDDGANTLIQAEADSSQAASGTVSYTASSFGTSQDIISNVTHVQVPMKIILPAGRAFAPPPPVSRWVTTSRRQYSRAGMDRGA